MKWTILLAWLQKAWEGLVEAFLKKTFPQYANLIQRADDVLSIAVECVAAAQATGADNATKKAQASQDLLARLKGANIDLPGDADLQICEVIVEAMVSGIKRFLGPT